jgi:hypothetical protein
MAADENAECRDQWTSMSILNSARSGLVRNFQRRRGPRGVGVLGAMATGSLNPLLWFSYLVTIALYARAFGAYGSRLVTLQLGIGGIPQAVIALLKGRTDLGIHSEMISDGVMTAY